MKTIIITLTLILVATFSYQLGSMTQKSVIREAMTLEYNRGFREAVDYLVTCNQVSLDDWIITTEIDCSQPITE